ncbi:type I polyketide synthase [Chitinimonas sp. BJB300]|uniref:type I polyketide synthase n=1 Tax=Chitinimonas sp. BJB300 TaxID=1559339 RepID=UPI0013043ACD|nr:type I polyketide synthase [Chitinimonas sp. BJB300]
MSIPTPQADRNPALSNPAAPIAVIGMAAMMPRAQDLAAYWRNILDETDCLEPVPTNRWRAEAYYNADPKVADHTYADRGGFIPDLGFDPLRYGIPPNSLAFTDTAQLYALAVGRQALLDAGYQPDQTTEGRRLPMARTGIVLGVSGNTMKLSSEMAKRADIAKWVDVLHQAGIEDAVVAEVADTMRRHYPDWNEDTFPGFLANVVAGRIANRFGLGAASHTVDAACASSLAAVRLACLELRSGAADVMLTGGVDTDNSNIAYLSFSKTPALSKSGKVRAFDAAADGTMISEGIGMLVLKRLDDAVADGDRIYGVIRGFGASTDGAGGAIFAPNRAGQERALLTAYADAGIDPTSIGLVEAHATGTVVGDAIEIEALEAVLGSAQTPIALGSVKAQIGHTKAAAGAASLIKTLLALYHKVIPPTLNVTQPNVRLHPGEKPFYLPRHAKPWLGSENAPRRAGVSVFGFGGTNVHVVLEEHDRHHPQPIHHRGIPILLGAESPSALAQRCLALAEQIARGDAATLVWPTQPLQPDAPRIGLLARNYQDAPALLRSAAEQLNRRTAETAWSLPNGIHYRSRAIEVGGKTVAVFSGQGSQTVGMGARLSIDHPAVRQCFEAFDAAGQARGLAPVSSLLFPPDTFDSGRLDAQRAALTHTQNAQTAIGAYNMALYGLMQRAGFCPDMALGHSFGELSALWAAGVFSDDAYRSAVLARGEALTPPPGCDEGGLIAISAPAEQLQTLLSQLPDLTLANLNSPKQTVAGGSADVLEQALNTLQQAGIQAVRIPVAAAFHTSLVSYAEAPWLAALADMPLATPRFPVWANLTAQTYPADEAGIRNLLAHQPFNTVQFRQQIEAIYAAGGRVFVEIGPRAVLSRLIGDILGDRPHSVLPVAQDPAGNDSRQLDEAMLRLAVLGLPLQLNSTEVLPPPAGPLEIRVSTAVIRQRGEGDWPALTHKHGVPPTSIVATVPVAAPSLPTAPAVQADVQTTSVAATVLTRLIAVVADKTGFPASLIEPSMSIEGDLGIDSIKRVEILSIMRDIFGTLPTNEAMAATRNLAELAQCIAQVQPSTMHQPALPTPPAPVPTPISAIPAVSNLHTTLGELLLRTVADKTGYPVEMLTLAMRLEGDLGVDSIKRVEILAAVRDALGLTETSANDALRSASTLGDMVTLLAALAPTEAEPATVTDKASVPASPLAAEASAHTGSDVAQLLLRTVADKTGFPVELLALEMRLEGDLGVDSIKRVEILAAVRDYLGLTDTTTSDALRSAGTLAEIAALLGAVGQHLQTAQAFEASTQPVTVAPPPQYTPVATPVTDRMVDAGALLLRTVADKTGFPVELLTLEMRLEGDLGVDSIKRVEILASLRDTLGLTGATASDELRSATTLAQIAALLQGAVEITHIASAARANIANAPVPAPVPETALPPTNNLPTIDMAAMARLLLQTVADKTGYPVEMLTLDMRLEGDLGVDSIKRVEILAAVRDALGVQADTGNDGLRSAATLAELAAQLVALAGNSQSSAPTPFATTTLTSTSRWQPLPVQSVALAAPPAHGPLRPPGQVAAIFADGTALTATLAVQMAQWGYRPVLIRLAGWTPTIDGLGTQAWPSRQATLDSLSECLSTLTHESGQPAVVVLLQTPDNARASRQRLGVALRVVKELLPALMAGTRLFAVARLDGRLGLNGTGDAVAGGLAGLIKTLRHELPTAQARFVDLAAELPAELAATYLLNEIGDTVAQAAEIGWHHGGRCSLVCGSPPAVGLSTLNIPPLQAHELVLVTGGARGVTAQCVQALAARLPAHFILIGRTHLAQTDPAWAAGITDMTLLKAQALQQLRLEGGMPTPRTVESLCQSVLAGREVRQNMQALAATGAKVSYLALDLGDAATTRTTIATLTAQHGRVAALIHGAGALADRRIADKTPQDIETVFRPKLDGLLTLVEALNDLPPQRVLLFSSTAGYSGNAGQSDYAMANEALSKLAFQLARRWPGTRAVSLAWGPWEGGMVTPALKKLFAERGVGLLPVADGTALFADAAMGQAAGGFQFVIGDTLPAQAPTPAFAAPASPALAYPQ